MNSRRITRGKPSWWSATAVCLRAYCARCSVFLPAHHVAIASATPPSFIWCVQEMRPGCSISMTSTHDHQPVDRHEHENAARKQEEVEGVEVRGRFALFLMDLCAWYRPPKRWRRKDGHMPEFDLIRASTSSTSSCNCFIQDEQRGNKSLPGLGRASRCIWKLRLPGSSVISGHPSGALKTASVGARGSARPCAELDDSHFARFLADISPLPDPYMGTSRLRPATTVMVNTMISKARCGMRS